MANYTRNFSTNHLEDKLMHESSMSGGGGGGGGGHYTSHHQPLSPVYVGHSGNNGLHSPSKSLSPTGYDYTIRSGGGSNGNGCLGGQQGQHSPGGGGGGASPHSVGSLHSPQPHSAYGSLSLNGLSGTGGGPLSPQGGDLSPTGGHGQHQHHMVGGRGSTPPPGMSLMERMERMREAMPQSPSPPLGMMGSTLQQQQQQQQQHLSAGSTGHGHMTSQQQQHHSSSKHSPPSSNVSNSSPSGMGGGGGGGREGGGAGSGGGGSELEEINTKELAARISAELKRYSIPQAIFAQRVLCRSQGTLSDLLRNPKPWSKLKSGRETFRRMWKWLQEPEFQRMSALRLAGKKATSSSSSSFSCVCVCVCVGATTNTDPLLWLRVVPLLCVTKHKRATAPFSLPLPPVCVCVCVKVPLSIVDDVMYPAGAPHPIQAKYKTAELQELSHQIPPPAPSTVPTYKKEELVLLF